MSTFSRPTDAVNVTAGSYHLFVYLASDPTADDPTLSSATCEVDFFEPGAGMRRRSARLAHYSFALSGGNGAGRYHAFRMICPKAAVTAVARFTLTNSRDPLLASASLFLVPTATLTYAASDAANRRYFCPIPIGRLHCYFDAPILSPTDGIERHTRGAYKIVAEFETAGSPAGDSEVPQGTVVYQSMWGTILDARAKAQQSTAAPTNVPITNGAAEYRFHPASTRLLIDVDFNDLTQGAVLKGPLTAELAERDFPVEYLAIGENFFLEGQYRTATEVFSRLKYPEATPTADHLIGSPKILVIAGEFLDTHLSALSGFTAVTEENAMEVLDDCGAEEAGIVLVESVYHRRGQPWKAEGTTPITEDPRLQELLRIAGQRGWTRVFWFSEENEHFTAFSSRLDHFDRLISETALDVESAAGFSGETAICPPFVDLRLTNPLITLPPNRGLYNFVEHSRQQTELKTLVVGWADLLEDTTFDGALDDASLEYVHICEDRWKLKANKVIDIPRLQSYVIGFVTDLQLISAYKRYGAALFYYPSLRSDAQLIRNIMLAASCNCLPIIYCRGRHPQVHSLIEEIAIITDEPDEVRQLIGRTARADLELARRRHLIWRSAALHNSSGRSVMAMFGIDDPKLPPRTEELLVSVITPTKRPEFLIQAYRQICEQRHPTWEWIVVLNLRGVSTLDLPQEITQDSRVRILNASPSKNIGFCLELGIATAKGSLWVKWDDDDFYGPGYILDTVLLSGMTSAELIGRPPAYFYFENSKGLYRRPGAALSFVVTSNGYRQSGVISGASLAGRVNENRSVTFEMDWRSSVDTDYMEAVGRSGAATCSGPNIGFVAVRAADPARHTWRAPESSLINVRTQHVGGDRELRLVLP